MKSCQCSSRVCDCGFVWGHPAAAVPRLRVLVTQGTRGSILFPSLSCRDAGTAIPCSAACPRRALVLWVGCWCWHLLVAPLQGLEEPWHSGSSRLAVPPCSHLCHTTRAPCGAWLMELLPLGRLRSPGCAGSTQTGTGCLCQQHCSTCGVGAGIHRWIAGPFFLWLPPAIFVKE